MNTSIIMVKSCNFSGKPFFKMKIRIKGNSIRLRLTKSQVSELCTNGFVKEQTAFLYQNFSYAVKLSLEHNELSVSYKAHTITLYLPKKLGANWNTTNEVGFKNLYRLPSGETLSLLLEKDFVCLDHRLEDQTDNYPNPKAKEF